MDTVSILIPVKNGMSWLPSILSALNRQSMRPGEIIAIDSGSSDGSADFLKAHDVRTECIEASAFHHAKTRNRLASLAGGDVLVFLNQDAIPVDEDWLGSLVRAMNQEPDVVASCSMEVNPKTGLNWGVSELVVGRNSKAKGVHVPEPYREDLFESLPPARKRQWMAWSTISAAVKTAYFSAHPFDESVRYGEDLEWSVRAYRDGRCTALSCDSRVFHTPPVFDARGYLALGLAEGYIERRVLGARESWWSCPARWVSDLAGLVFAPGSDKAQAFPYEGCRVLGRVLTTRTPLAVARWLDSRFARR